MDNVTNGRASSATSEKPLILPQISSSRPSPVVSARKRAKKKSRSSVCAFTGNTKYSVVRNTLQEADIKVVEEETDLMEDRCVLVWMDTGVLMETVMQLKPWQSINHFPGMHEICRKDNLTRNLNKMRKLFPGNEFTFYPRSWLLPTDFMDFMTHVKAHKRSMYIAKPDSSSQGRGIFLFKDPTEEHVAPLIHAKTSDMIIQKYVPRPLLLDGNKFDFRVYVLVESCNPLRAFVYKEGLVRFATCPYESPSTNNATNVFMHLTNYAVNKKNSNFDKSLENGSKRYPIASTFQMRRLNQPVDRIWADMKDAIVKTLLVVQPYLERVYECCTSRQCKSDGSGTSMMDRSQCFEVLGFDVLLDYKFKPWILEVNHSPSLTCDAEIDLEVKGALLRDTLRLLGFHESHRSLHAFRKQLLKDGREESLRRLFAKSTTPPTLDLAERVLDGRPLSSKMNSSSRDTWEKANCGEFERIYPPTEADPPSLKAKYEVILEAAKKTIAIDSKETNSTKARKAYIQEMKKKKEEETIRYVERKKAKIQAATGQLDRKATIARLLKQVRAAKTSTATNADSAQSSPDITRVPRFRRAIADEVVSTTPSSSSSKCTPETTRSFRLRKEVRELEPYPVNSNFPHIGLRNTNIPVLPAIPTVLPPTKNRRPGKSNIRTTFLHEDSNCLSQCTPSDLDLPIQIKGYNDARQVLETLDRDVNAGNYLP